MNRIMDDLRAAFERSGLIRARSSWIGSFALGIGLGVLAGAATALLLAPLDGPDTRRRLGTTARQLAGKTAGLVDKARGSVRQLASESHKAKNGRDDGPVT